MSSDERSLIIADPLADCSILLGRREAERSGVTIGWTMSMGPRVPEAPEFQTKKYISLATQSKFDLIRYSYSVSTPVDVDLSLKVK